MRDMKSLAKKLVINGLQKSWLGELAAETWPNVLKLA
jgi:hypothetical protein